MQEVDGTAENCRRSQQNSLMDWGRWEDLDTYILMEIFSRLPLDDVILNTCLVCHSWRSVSWQFLLWSRNELDLGFSMAAFNNYLSAQSDLLLLYSEPKFPGKYSAAHQYDQMAGKLTKQLKQIMEGNDAFGHSLEDWRRSIHTIIIPYDLELSDEHLLYIAERTPGVTHLSLLGTHKITADGFGKVIQNWKFVKSIHLGPIKDENCCSQIIIEIGRNCREVEELYMHQAKLMIDETNSLMFAIVNNLPGLKVLGFEAAVVYVTWLPDFLPMFHQLEEIHFHECEVTLDFAIWPLHCCLGRTADGETSKWRANIRDCPTPQEFMIEIF